jgi:DNA-binding FadR family transcriptional regulator
MVEPIEYMNETIIERVAPAAAGRIARQPTVVAQGRLRFRRVRSARAFEAIAGQIRGEMQRRRLLVGDRLPPERTLAAQFGVSRNTLREALRSLENAGLLTLRKGATGGAFVRESTGDAVIAGLRDMFQLGAMRPEHLTEARVMIESIAVRSACARATASDIAALKNNIASAVRAEREGAQFFDIASIHLEFHRILARATKNPVMVIVMEALIDVMNLYIRAIGQRRNPWVMPSRRRFIRHFEARDADAAVTEMTRHLERLNRHYLSLAVGQARTGASDE